MLRPADIALSDSVRPPLDGLLERRARHERVHERAVERLRGSAPTAHDLAYALDRFHAVVGDAVSAAGAFDSTFDNAGASASFGLTTDLATASRQALAAARVIDEGLIALDKGLAREVGFVADVALVVHAGPAVIGPLGYGRDRASSAFGDAVGAAQRLAERAVQARERFTITRVAAAAAALAVEPERWHVPPGAAVEVATADHVP